MVGGYLKKSGWEGAIRGVLKHILDFRLFRCGFWAWILWADSL